MNNRDKKERRIDKKKDKLKNKNEKEMMIENEVWAIGRKKKDKLKNKKTKKRITKIYTCRKRIPERRGPYPSKPWDAPSRAPFCTPYTQDSCLHIFR